MKGLAVCLSGLTLLGAVGLVFYPSGGRIAGQPSPRTAEATVLTTALVIKRVGQYGRSIVHMDAIEALVVAGRWKVPREDDAITLPDGNKHLWEKAVAGKDGSLSHPALVSGYASWQVRTDRQRVMILEASGHGMVYVNGEPRTGDIYQTGFVRLPVLLRSGDNELLFQCARGRLTARLLEPKSELLFNPHDMLLPDLITGADHESWGSVVVMNASAEPSTGVALEIKGLGLETILTSLPVIPPLSIAKVGFRVRAAAPANGDTIEAQLALVGGQARTLDTTKLRFRVRRAGQVHVRTFLSGIDGSVQYYAVNPAQPLHKDAPLPALFLTLHGAGVQATGQAESYAPKTWGHLVAPTNRRPFGFDWEDWGRLDALEVLELARKELNTDPQRTYLTGHSMGGHGVWHLGATYPDHFAAIGPSAGWPTFWSYTGAKRPEAASALLGLVQRATNPSDTLMLAPNLAQQGVYILHGEADDNVPVTQARLMRQRLSGFHHDLIYHEQPKAGHWWDASDEPGTDCVDWAPMFDLFARRVLPRPEMVRDVAFVTANPGVSARSQWLSIEAQQHPLQFSSVKVRFDPGRRRFSGVTENVARLALDLNHVRPDAPLGLELDGQKLQGIPWPRDGRRLWLQRDRDAWVVVDAPPSSFKGPHRYGLFRDAFRNRMLFVYGTKGTAAENAWAFAKARYDAETFWYRGNGTVEVLADAAFTPERFPERNVIVYGNADSNGAWSALLGGGPVQVRRGAVTVGGRTEKGEELACVFLRPRPGSERACVGVVAGSGLSGMRLSDRLPLFVSGVGYPDWIVLGSEMLTRGDPGVRAAGYFGLDWSVDAGDLAWRD